MHGRIVTNADIAELLYREAERATGHLQRALRRAAHRAFLWPVQAAAIAAAGEDLTALDGVGPVLARTIAGWLDEPPDVPEPPLSRRGFLTLAEAREVIAAAEPLPLRGDLQMHTTYSDGGGTLREMAAAAVDRGYEYIGITDHSKGLKIAKGMDEDRLAAQGEEIAALNDEIAAAGGGLHVLRSIEMNISPTGEGDMEPGALERLDLVVGSFHSALRTKDDQTGRYLAALRNPHLDILGHPRGRMFGRRDGLDADWPRVFEEAAALDKAVEVDAYPDRQDLDVERLHLVRESGCRVAVDTDAHAPWQLDYIDLGVAAVLLAGIDRGRIVNILHRDELVRWARSN